MSAALVAGLLAGYGIAVPVGAVATHLVTLTARTSLRTGVCAALGVATADGLYALLATLGGSAMAAALRPALVPLRWASALL
ncbi:LysE family transporter, partial [Streptomyces sp. HYC2]